MALNVLKYHSKYTYLQVYIDSRIQYSNFFWLSDDFKLNYSYNN